MSKYELLDKSETEAARTQGWGLHHVFDLKQKRWSVMVLAMPSAVAGSNHVIQQAQMGSALAKKALRLVMESNNPAAPKRRKS